MATAGPNNPITVANDASFGSVAWSNPTNARFDDNTRATAALTFGQITNYLKATDFDFSIDSNISITGIMFRFLKSRTDALGNIMDERCRIVIGGTIQSTDVVLTTDWPVSEAYAEHGNSIQLWGQASITAEQVNASDFGVVIAAKCTSSEGTTARVDSVDCTVYGTNTLMEGVSFTAAGELAPAYDIIASMEDPYTGSGDAPPSMLLEGENPDDS
jgi:hypothetical protein